MSRREDGTMTAETMQPGDFESRVTEIVNRILAHHKPLPQRTDSDRELTLQGFTQMEKRFDRVDKRFEEMLQYTNARFEQVDRHFEQMREDMNRRFEQVDKRFEQMREDMNKRFDESRQDMLARFEQVDKRFEQVDKRFEQVDKRFEESRQDMLARFEQVDKRFDETRQDMFTRFDQVDKRLDRQIDVLKWSVGLLATLFIGLMTVFKYVA